MRHNIRNISFWIIGIIFYYIWFQAFYNMIAFGDIFPYRTNIVLKQIHQLLKLSTINIT